MAEAPKYVLTFIEKVMPTTLGTDYQKRSIFRIYCIVIRDFVTDQNQESLIKIYSECVHSGAYSLSNFFRGYATSRKHAAISRLVLNSYVISYIIPSLLTKCTITV
jgi:hypothetical protein